MSGRVAKSSTLCGLLALFKRLHQIVGTLLQADNFSVTLYDEETDRLSFPYHVDEHEPRSKPSKPAAGTLCAEIIRTRQPIMLTPETMTTRLKELRASVDTNPLCWLGVPLKSHSGTIGVLVVKSYPGGRFGWFGPWLVLVDVIWKA
jgi:transcriptional regulator with GAF, ATPase, and Fis domain